MSENTTPGITRLTIGYSLDGEAREFTVDVEEINDLQNATKALQLHLMAQILDIRPWVNTRERVRFAGGVNVNAARLEYLRGQIQAESISWGEIAELQGLAAEIDPSDVELLEWAGVPEFPDEDEGGGITPEGQLLGHRYVMGAVNAYCPKCSDEQGVCVLDCDYDLDK